MPLRREKFLAAAHELHASYLCPEAVVACDRILRQVTSHPEQVLPPPDRRLPARAGPPLWIRPRARRPVTYFRLNRRLEMIDVAPATLALLEVESADDLLGTMWEQFVDDPHDLHVLHDHWLEAAQTHQGFTYTLTFHTPRGHRLQLRQWVRPMRDAKTLEVTGWFGCLDRVGTVIHLDPPPAGQISA